MDKVTHALVDLIKTNEIAWRIFKRCNAGKVTEEDTKALDMIFSKATEIAEETITGKCALKSIVIGGEPIFKLFCATAELLIRMKGVFHPLALTALFPIFTSVENMLAMSIDLNRHFLKDDEEAIENLNQILILLGHYPKETPNEDQNGS